MKAIRRISALHLLAFAFVAHLPAQQTEADRKLFAQIKAVAEKGDASAQYNLGICYYEAVGVTKDEAEAVKWYRKAADQGFAPAQMKLGLSYYLGDGVTKDESEAVKWFRKSAELGDPNAQCNLGSCYSNGYGLARDEAEGVRWYRKAADQGLAEAQSNLGRCYFEGIGVTKDATEAVKWLRKAATQGLAGAQANLGICYANGEGVRRDTIEAAKWYRQAAEQGYAEAQAALGARYILGDGVPKDYLEAYKWINLASANGLEAAKMSLATVEQLLTPQQIADAQKLSREFKPRSAFEADSQEGIASSRPTGSGTGFFISEDGFLVTNEHVVRSAMQIRLVTGAGLISAKVLKVDAANDLALLKAERIHTGLFDDIVAPTNAASPKFAVLPVATSRGISLGSTVATIGFPNIGLQGFSPKLAKGEIASLSGAQDDTRYFQISVPLQPGNSGGALVNDRGNVIGVVSAKLNARAALATSGALPENVNYAVKSSFLLSFLESVPEVSAKLKQPNEKEMKFEEVAKTAEKAAVLVLVY